MARIIQILTASSPDAPMESRPEVRAVPGKGLEGDRYFDCVGTFSPYPQKPDFEVTLIEQENVDAFAEASGLDFTAEMARRNIVTTGVRLNDLVDREFTVGDVRLKGCRLCEPCDYLSKQTHPDVLKGLLHKGGLRAQILTEGVIAVGDTITTA